MDKNVVNKNVSQRRILRYPLFSKLWLIQVLKKGSLVCLFLIIFMFGVRTGKKRIIPFVNTRSEYMIGMYSGSSPFSLQPFKNINPVMTAGMVTDIKAGFVADPFMIKEQGRWYMFFEIMKEPQHKGVIGVATSTDGLEWKYEKVVLEEPFHLSYPMVFKNGNEILMIPESHENYEISIYKADSFPCGWKKCQTLIEGNYHDPTVVSYGNYWYLFTVDRDDILHLFWADNIYGPWNKHPWSPIVKFDLEHARPCGRIITTGKSIIRFAQNCKPHYGWDVHAFIVSDLTPEKYQEEPYSNNPLLQGTGVLTDWNGVRMHHIDLHQEDQDNWFAAVDGVGRWSEYGLGFFGDNTLSIGPKYTPKSPYRKMKKQ